MRAILLRQEFNEGIPAGLPPGTPVAHKTGWIRGVLHDAAIVYPADRKPYVLVILTRGIPDESVARSLIVDVSRLVYGEAVPHGAASSRQRVTLRLAPNTAQ
jgi:beta-lactamase class A